MHHNDHPLVTPDSGSPPSSAAPATASILRGNELTKLHQSMLQRAALGAITQAGISHGGVDGDAAEQILRNEHNDDAVSGSNIFRDPLAPALPTETGVPAQRRRSSAADDMMVDHSPRREGRVSALLLLSNSNHNNGSDKNNRGGGEEPVHLDLRDRQSFRSAWKRSGGKIDRDGSLVADDVEASVMRNFSGATAGPDDSDIDADDGKNGQKQTQQRKFSLTGMPVRLSFSSGGGGVLSSGGNNNGSDQHQQDLQSRGGGSSSLLLNDAGAEAGTSAGGGGGYVQSELPSARSSVVNMMTGGGLAAGAAAPGDGIVNSSRGSRSSSIAAPAAAGGGGTRREERTGSENDFVRGMVDSEDDGDVRDQLPAATTFGAGASGVGGNTDEVEITENSADYVSPVHPHWHQQQQQQQHQPVEISPYTFKPRNNPIFSINNDNSSPQHTAGGQNSSSRSRFLSSSSPITATMNEKRREPTLFPGGTNFEFPRVADPFSTFSGFSARPMHAALSINPTVHSELQPNQPAADLTSSLHTASGGPFGASVGSSPSEVQTVSQLVKAHAKDAQERREVQQKQHQQRNSTRDSDPSLAVSAVAWARPSFVEQQQQQQRESVQRTSRLNTAEQHHEEAVDVAGAVDVVIGEDDDGEEEDGAEEKTRTPEKQKIVRSQSGASSNNQDAFEADSERKSEVDVAAFSLPKEQKREEQASAAVAVRAPHFNHRTPPPQQQHQPVDTAEGSSTAERILAMRLAGADRLKALDLSQPLKQYQYYSHPRADVTQQKQHPERPHHHQHHLSSSSSTMVDLPVVVSPIPHKDQNKVRDAILDQTGGNMEERLEPQQRRLIPAVVSPTYPHTAAASSSSPNRHQHKQQHLPDVNNDEQHQHSPSSILGAEAELERCDPDRVAVWAAQPAEKARRKEEEAAAAKREEERAAAAADRPSVPRQLQTLPKRPAGYFHPRSGGGAGVVVQRRVTENPAFDTFDEVPEELRGGSERFVYRDEEDESTAAPEMQQRQYAQSQQNEPLDPYELELVADSPAVAAPAVDERPQDQQKSASASFMLPVSLSATLSPPSPSELKGQTQQQASSIINDDRVADADHQARAAVLDAAEKAAGAAPMALAAVAALPVAAALSGAQVASKIMPPVPNTGSTSGSNDGAGAGATSSESLSPLKKAVTFDLGGGAVFEQDAAAAAAAKGEGGEGADVDAGPPIDANSNRPEFESDGLFTKPSRDHSASAEQEQEDDDASPQQDSPAAKQPVSPLPAIDLSSKQEPEQKRKEQEEEEGQQHGNSPPPQPEEPQQHPQLPPPPLSPKDDDEAATTEQEQEQFDLVEPEAVSLTLRECKQTAIITEKLHRLRTNPSYLRPCKQRIAALWKDYLLLYAEDADPDSTPCEPPVRLITAQAAAATASSSTAHHQQHQQQQQQQQQFHALDILNRDDPETAKRVPSSIKWPLVLGKWADFASSTGKQQHQHQQQQNQPSPRLTGLAAEKKARAILATEGGKAATIADELAAQFRGKEEAMLATVQHKFPESTKKVDAAVTAGLQQQQQKQQSSPMKPAQLSPAVATAAAAGEGDHNNIRPHTAPIVLSFASRNHREQWHEALGAIQARALRRQRALQRQKEFLKHEQQQMKQRQQQQQHQAGGDSSSPSAPDLASLLQSSLSMILQQQQQQQNAASASSGEAAGSLPLSAANSASRFSDHSAVATVATSPPSAGAASSGDSLAATLGTTDSQVALAGAAIDLAEGTGQLTSQQKELAKGVLKLWNTGGGSGASHKPRTASSMNNSAASVLSGGGGGGGSLNASTSSALLEAAAPAAAAAAGGELTPQQMEAAKAVLKMWNRK